MKNKTMLADLTILYRGELSSCNYACGYCPFSKRHDTAAQLALDREQLQRFVAWLQNRTRTTAVFFTPWGEALTRRWYREALQLLSHEPLIQKLAVQTNLSCDLAWLRECQTQKIGLWCTYHPSQTTREQFLDQCRRLRDLNVSFSVGMVGLPDDLAEIEALRRELPTDVYLWINAWDTGDEEKYVYSDEERARLLRVDPFFATNAVAHPSFGRVCETGRTVISVDGTGEVRRCHFVPTRIGNIYANDFERSLQSRTCPNETCGCHIGYVHLPELKQQTVYGRGILERVPATFQLQPGELQ